MIQWMTQVVPECGSAPGRDWELLRRYVEHGCEDAFTDLVSSYAPLVYSAALRQTSNASLAEEVTQAVFVLLAQKASNRHPCTPLQIGEETRCFWPLEAIQACPRPVARSASP